jgi:hypothetical protein
MNSSYQPRAKTSKVTRLDRRTLSKASRKTLARLAKFVKLDVPCSCHVCLVEALVRKLDLV